MDYWGKKVNVSKAAAKQQVAIIEQLPSKKRFEIALQFAEMGIAQTRKWIKKNNPHFTEMEITLEFVRITAFETGRISPEHWAHFKAGMEKRIERLKLF